MRKFLPIEHNGKYYCGQFNTATDFILENAGEIVRSSEIKAQERAAVQKQYVERQVEKLPHIKMNAAHHVSYRLKQHRRKIKKSAVAVSLAAAASAVAYFFM